VFGARGVRGKGKGGKWDGHELKKLTGKLRRSEGREEAPAFATAAARWCSGGAAGGVPCVGKARGKGSRAGRGRGATRGAASSWRWRWGRPRTAVSGGAEEKQRSSRGPRGRRERGVRGTFCKHRKVQGPHYKLKFPTKQKLK
jgi:hypothetical protein